jgi:hypothetical protein
MPFGLDPWDEEKREIVSRTLIIRLRILNPSRWGRSDAIISNLDTESASRGLDRAKRRVRIAGT